MIEYLTAVRHRLRFIVAAAVLGALLIGGLTALLREPKVQVAYWVGDSGDREIALLLGAPASIVPVFDTDDISIEIEVDLLATNNKRWLDGLISIDTLSEDRLVVNVVDQDKDVAKALAHEILNRAVQRHRAEFQSNLDRIETATEQRVTFLLSELGDLQSSPSESTGVQTFMVYTELLGHQRVLAGLTQLRLSQTGGITEPSELGVPVEKDPSSPITFGLLGLILGTVLASAATVVRRFFEPRILSAEDVERAVFTPRFIEIIRSLDASADSNRFIGLAAAATGGLDSSDDQAIQLVGAPGNYDLAAISRSLAEALNSLGLHSQSFEAVTEGKMLSETLAVAANQIASSPGISVVATRANVQDLADAVAIGRLTSRSVIVVSARETRLSTLSEIVREFEVSGIDCDGVLILSN